MEVQKYTVGTMEPYWGEDDIQSLTFIVTEDCNLRCKYCYVTHKTQGNTLQIDTAKKFIDYVLTTKRFHRCKSVVLDFIGGEPLLEAKLISEISDYFKIRAYEEGVPWYWRYRISITTNGVNYSNLEVQKLIQRNEGKISIGITIDGTKEKHDLQRVFPDGTGSYEVIYENLKLWLSQFPGNTKVTFASEDLIYLKDSIIHLWNEGIHSIAANVVFENVWKEGDDKILEEQLKLLADYIIDNNLYDKYYCTFFLEHIGLPYAEENLSSTSCGAGKMLALSPNGNIYPCMRYCDYSLNNKEGYIIGNVDDGIDFEKSRVFLLAMYKYQCDEECLKCPIAQGCEFCQGFSYDEADTHTNFQKAKYICKMHKARVRANNYYFARLYHKKGIRRENYWWKNELLFLLDSEYSSICSYIPKKRECQLMSKETIERGLCYAAENFLKPIFIHSAKEDINDFVDYEDIEILHMIPIEIYSSNIQLYDYQLVVTENNINLLENVPNQHNIIFNIMHYNIERLSDCVKKIMKKCDRINLNVQGITSEFNNILYEHQLQECADYIKQYFEREGVLKELNVVTDMLFIEKHEGCTAGEYSFTYAPDGKFYVCPAYYSEEMDIIGNAEEGIEIKNQKLYSEEYMPLCNMCAAYQCENCKYINFKNTNEVNISPSFQCIKAQIEKRVSYYLQETMKEIYQFSQKIENTTYDDPIVLLKENGNYMGYYE